MDLIFNAKAVSSVPFLRCARHPFQSLLDHGHHGFRAVTFLEMKGEIDFVALFLTVQLNFDQRKSLMRAEEIMAEREFLHSMDPNPILIPLPYLKLTAKLLKRKDVVESWPQSWQPGTDLDWRHIWEADGETNALPPFSVEFHRELAFCRISFDLTFIGSDLNTTATPKVEECFNNKLSYMFQSDKFMKYG